MFESLTLHGRRIEPALFLAPMAGITHSAFRRLLADFGGYGALVTEMLSTSAFLKENLETSPYTRRRPEEGAVLYQFQTSGDQPIEQVFPRLAQLDVAAIDLNLGCPAPEIQQQRAGAALFRDFDRLRDVLTRIRRVYDGPLTVKCRLGDDPDAWRDGFIERLRLFEDMDVAAITVHPRFSTEKLKRRARWEEFPWVCAQTRLPVIGNGDVCGVEDVRRNEEAFRPLAGLMLGRIVAVKPWIFLDFAGIPRPEIDHAEVFDRMHRYIVEDFPPERAFSRLKEFSFYFAKNFLFGHELFRHIQQTRTVPDLRTAALAFLERRPTLRAEGYLPFS